MYVDNAVGVNVEGDLHLGDTTGRGRDTNQLELACGRKRELKACIITNQRCWKLRRINLVRFQINIRLLWIQSELKTTTN